MVAKAPAARLLVPANRNPSREHLFAGEPYFLRPTGALPVDARPRILSFESDAFMDDFLAIAAGKRPAPPKLLPWRDWAEPPAGLVDVAGAPRYPTTATGIVRRPPDAADIEASTGPAMDCSPAELAAIERIASARRAVRSSMVRSIIDSGINNNAPINASSAHFWNKGFFMVGLLWNERRPVWRGDVRG